jgi:hypothetical protein
MVSPFNEAVQIKSQKFRSMILRLYGAKLGQLPADKSDEPFPLKYISLHKLVIHTHKILF